MALRSKSQAVPAREEPPWPSTNLGHRSRGLRAHHAAAPTPLPPPAVAAYARSVPGSADSYTAACIPS
eukprot:372957-Rhodomonas_salina.3